MADPTLTELRREIAALWRRVGKIPVRRSAGGPGSSGSQRFRVKSVLDDHLECVRYDANADSEGPDTVLVAKPYELRRSPFDGTGAVDYPDGQSISYTYQDLRTRDADDGTVVQTEKMTPNYWIDSQILASKPDGGTGVKVDGSFLVWEDENRGGRHWAVR